ncbi:TRAP transporter large permease [Qaidamihabitans albus]|uniref:TRAP transporter large permease n=1 Tax=Qaidamihabitans albus TaxID=2795733 RepID=UPI0018F1BE84|nr:TRAP transporter large permease subunit [Qaidamihabitans albus]
MEWYWILALAFGILVTLMLTRMPIFLAFALLNVVGILWLYGYTGSEQLVLSISSSLSSLVLLPIPMFILMGEVTFRSGVAKNVITALDQWLGRFPGRLGLLAVSAGAAFSALTGTSTAGTAMLGSVLTPEMEARKYGKSMSLGPILGSGGLALMIPPSSLAVVLGAIGEISIGQLLLAIIIPGILMAVLYGGYIVIRSAMQPSVAPPYDVASTSLGKKVRDTAVYVVPISALLFLTVGVILLGVATPTEAAALGAVGAFILVAVYGRLTPEVVRSSVLSTVRNSGMILIIVAASTTFSQLLSFSGAAQGFVDFAVNLGAAPIIIVIAMMAVVFVMGGFMSLIGIMMITLPVFIPVVTELGYDPIWFGVLFLLNIEMALTTPPLGMNLYVMQGVAPKGTTLGQIVRAAVPFLALDAVAMVLILVFPELALWLPEFMGS